ncbi:unnamed protein product [Paramecium sonneborni]|uniref:Uncharacterized protein n=1 Tax=Paramecium sonneborni TaxID=65129 RepID=A0A8S1M2W3_9CILI|nr:unnamed protein product [Paramecium sonneborni]
MSQLKHKVIILILISTCGGEKIIKPSEIKNITTYQYCSHKWNKKIMIGSKTICSSGSFKFQINKNGYNEGGDIHVSVLNEIGLNLVRTVSDMGSIMDYYKNDFNVVLNLNF